MLRLILHWVLSAACLLLVARFVRGISVSGFGTALFAALLVGLVNGTLGWLLKIVTLPLTVITFGLFWFVINALMLKLVAAMISGFEVKGFLPALIGAFILSLLNMVIRWIVR